MIAFPSELFRFRPWSVFKRKEAEIIERKSIKELEDGCFYFSSPHVFDDPQDNQLGAHATGHPLDIDRWLIHDLAGIPELMRKYNIGSVTELRLEIITEPADQRIFKAAVMRRARRNSRILCLSSDWKSELMWSLYAERHYGFCLCFDTEHDFFKVARPVLYAHAPTDVAHLGDSLTDHDQLAFCKSIAWQFQKEWRIVLPGAEPARLPFPKEKLTAVIVGYRFPHYKELQSVLIKNNYRVKIFRTERIPNSYELKLIELDATR